MILLSLLRGGVVVACNLQGRAPLAKGCFAADRFLPGKPQRIEFGCLARRCIGRGLGALSPRQSVCSLDRKSVV